MTVPTHNLYDFVHQALENKFLLYYFFPYGEKKLENLISYKNYLIDEKNFCFRVFPKNLVDDDLYSYFNPEIICNDQEPLDFEFYQNQTMQMDYIANLAKNTLPGVWTRLENFQWRFPSNRKKYLIILHSELNSKQVDLYNNSGKFVCAYWWSHAILALDWYRFAQHDKFLNPASKIKKLFLLYARDCTGSREYRYILQKLIDNANLRECQVGSFDTEYSATGNSSAEYSYNDINQSAIQIVAETVFDERIHLTEKTLRPIACGQPFILVAGPGSLKYLKSYGFKTFAPWINEEYDNELDCDTRLQMIVAEMQRIENLSDADKKNLIEKCLEISKHNKKLFFSNKFFNKVKSELVVNIAKAQETTKNELDWKFMWQYRQERKKESRENYKASLRNFYEMKFIRHLKKGGTIEDYEPPF